MKHVAALLLAFALIWPAHAGSAQLRHLVGVSFDARVTNVSDGDTVDVIRAGERIPIRVRLEGIDAPERGESLSERARTFARVLLFDQQVRVAGRDVDRYGRLVARLVVRNRDASVELVSAGLACHYTYYSSDPVLAKAQAEARLAARGFWAADVPKPRCAAGSPPRSPAPIVTARAAFHGNTSSHLYHAASCRNYTCRTCTRVFASEAEAKAAGFKPARDCLPR